MILKVRLLTQLPVLCMAVWQFIQLGGVGNDVYYFVLCCNGTLDLAIGQFNWAAMMFTIVRDMLQWYCYIHIQPSKIIDTLLAASIHSKHR